ncbi:hypothetical protein FOF48_20555 [Corallococcus sp. Z5C101001]|nr:hypothetical protein FOF48_20555 [Corallococcus sp. Z5C101001]
MSFRARRRRRARRRAGARRRRGARRRADVRGGGHHPGHRARGGRLRGARRRPGRHHRRESEGIHAEDQCLWQLLHQVRRRQGLRVPLHRSHHPRWNPVGHEHPSEHRGLRLLPHRDGSQRRSRAHQPSVMTHPARSR